MGELNLLADAIGSMDREQIVVYEGAVQLELNEKCECVLRTIKMQKGEKN